MEKQAFSNEQILEALGKSVTHWREIVGVFGDTKTGDALADPDMEAKDCAVCRLFDFEQRDGETACEDCIIGDCCDDDSLYQKVLDATTNHAAWVAAKAMLARLEELLAEYDAKVKDAENDIRVGDFVYSTSANDPQAHLNCGVVTKISTYMTQGRHYMNADGSLGLTDAASLILIHRPAAKGK